MKNILLISLLIITSLAACKKDDPTTTSHDLSIELQHEIEGFALQWDSLWFANSLNQTFGVSTLKYFISDIYAFTNGDSILLKEIHYVDAQDSSTLNFSAIIPADKNIDMIKFRFGISKAKNIDGMFKNPPESNMVWPINMGGGYHYMKFEGKFIDQNNQIDNFQAHSGPLMMADYSVLQVLPSNFTMTSDKSIKLIFELDKVLGDPNALDLSDVSGIMGNDAMQQKLFENCHSAFRL